MTSEEAKELREHLIDELDANGLGFVVQEVITRTEEDYSEEDYGEVIFDRNSRSLLIYFIKECISVLDGLSNKDFPGLLNKLNENNEGNKIESIVVELLSDEPTTYYNLSQLPNYNEIIIELNEVLIEIQSEN
jgi:hypothetical protein